MSDQRQTRISDWPILINHKDRCKEQPKILGTMTASDPSSKSRLIGQTFIVHTRLSVFLTFSLPLIPSHDNSLDAFLDSREATKLSLRARAHGVNNYIFILARTY